MATFPVGALVLVALELGLGVGCGKGDAGAAGKASKATPGEPTTAVPTPSENSDSVAGTAARATELLATVKKQLAAGENGKVSCARAKGLGVDVTAVTVAPIVSEIRALCELDVPLAAATAALTMAEQTRVTSPNDIALPACASGDWSIAIATLTRVHGSDPRVADLVARWNKACPTLTP